MAIKVVIVKSSAQASSAEVSKTFSAQGGSIGRGPDNDWVLVDPERYLSSRHCEITCEGGRYYLTDLSTNGTFLNSSAEPIGRGARVPLSNGDVFDVGDYQFRADLVAADASPPASPFDVPAGPVFGDDFGSSSALFSDPFAGSPLLPSAELFGSSQEEVDPLAALDKLGHASMSDPFAAPRESHDLLGGTHSDGAMAMDQAVSWPDAKPDGSLIPENWDDDILGGDLDVRSASEPSPSLADTPQFSVPVAPAAAPFSASPSAAEPQAEPPPKPAMSAPAAPKRPRPSPAPSSARSKRRSRASAAPSSAATETDRMVVDAIGLGEFDLDDEHIREINETVGELVRETVIGMMQTLRSRASIKNEFRMNVTTIQPIENNPLKFSANIDDALENMFIKQSNAYKNPVEAIREGFQGIAEHQVALLAGIRSAFSSMMERFDPEVLEKQFERKSKASLLPGLGKAKYWSAYTEHYKNLADNMENSFQYLFGDEFVQAYEDQLRKLSRARRKDPI